MNKYKKILLISLIILTIIPIAQFHLVKFHPMQSGSFTTNTSDSVDYQLGYDRRGEIYLLLWTNSANQNFDIYRSNRPISNTIYEETDVMHGLQVTSKGLRIYFPDQNFEEMTIKIYPVNMTRSLQDFVNVTPLISLTVSQPTQYVIFHDSFTNWFFVISFIVIILVDLLVYYKRGTDIDPEMQENALAYPDSSAKIMSVPYFELVNPKIYYLLFTILLLPALFYFGRLFLSLVIFVPLVIALGIYFIAKSIIPIFKSTISPYQTKISMYLMLFLSCNFFLFYNRHLMKFELFGIIPYLYIYGLIFVGALILNSSPDVYITLDNTNRILFRLQITVFWLFLSGLISVMYLINIAVLNF